MKIIILLLISLKGFSQSYIVVNKDGSITLDKQPPNISINVLPPLYSPNHPGDSNLTFGIDLNKLVDLIGNGSGGVQKPLEIQQPQFGIKGQKDFTFIDVPANYADYLIFIDKYLASPGIGYTANGNVITLAKPSKKNTVVIFRRLR